MDDHSDEIECSYCGKSVYADSPRCPKCGNYTDGLGPRARGEQPGREGRRIPRVFVIAGWLVVLCLVLPLLLALWAKMKESEAYNRELMRKTEEARRERK